MTLQVTLAASNVARLQCRMLPDACGELQAMWVAGRMLSCYCMLRGDVQGSLFQGSLVTSKYLMIAVRPGCRVSVSQAHVQASRLAPWQHGFSPVAADGTSPDSTNKKQRVEDAVANLGSKDPEWQAKLNVRLLPSAACTFSLQGSHGPKHCPSSTTAIRKPGCSVACCRPARIDSSPHDDRRRSQ